MFERRAKEGLKNTGKTGLWSANVSSFSSGRVLKARHNSGTTNARKVFPVHTLEYVDIKRGQVYRVVETHGFNVNSLDSKFHSFIHILRYGESV